MPGVWLFLLSELRLMPLRRIPPSDGAHHLVRVRGNVSVMLNDHSRIFSPTIYDAPNKLQQQQQEQYVKPQTQRLCLKKSS
jgi:hypothetical protein